MGLLNDCKNVYNTQDLYQILESCKSATEKELKKAYYKASLKVHPDRAALEEKDIATQKFQILGKVYSILSDVDQRAVYDETGEVDDENLDSKSDWDLHWRIFFKKISVDDIKNFETKYKGSSEELGDLKQAYLDGKGNMDFILQNILCATSEDEERFSAIIRKWIKRKEVEDFPKFSKETEAQKEYRKRKASSEAAEAEELKKQLGLDDSTQSLHQLIRKRGQERGTNMDSFFDHLASKYAGDKKARKKRKDKKK